MSRSASSINPRLNKKLAAYAAAASTAIGAGNLSSAQPGEAEVVYTKTHIEVNTGTPIDLNDKFKVRRPIVLLVRQLFHPARRIGL
jgi:hypothetical protein